MPAGVLADEDPQQLAFHERRVADHAQCTLLTSSLALFGGYVLRETVVYAGRDSADDPRAYLRHPE